MSRIYPFYTKFFKFKPTGFRCKIILHYLILWSQIAYKDVPRIKKNRNTIF